MDGIDLEVQPSGNGCKECLEIGGWWFHLRCCAVCGHIGCCDSSPYQHATRHFEETGHRFMASFEPGESWYWDYVAHLELEGPPLAEPRWHPIDQAIPGPEGVAPLDWREKIG